MMKRIRRNDPNQLNLLGETPRQKFVRLANARSARAIKAIRSLAHLSDKRRYTYKVGDAESICDVIADEVGKLRTAMLNPSKSRGIAPIIKE